MDAVNRYKRLSDAIEFYENELEYKYVDVPWAVPSYITNMTKPVGKGSWDDVSTYAGPLVASAEQSFMWLMAQEMLEPGEYVACTPCFRQGDINGKFHHPNFMKVELINTRSTELVDLDIIMFDASLYFSKYLDVEIQKTDDGFDLVSKVGGIELGSYGIREIPRVGRWVYGTGCAEPRLSEVIREVEMITRGTTFLNN